MLYPSEMINILHQVIFYKILNSSLPIDPLINQGKRKSLDILFSLNNESNLSCAQHFSKKFWYKAVTSHQTDPT